MPTRSTPHIFLLYACIIEGQGILVITFVYVNTRFLQRPFSFYKVLTVHQKSSSFRSSRKDNKGLKKRKRIKEFKFEGLKFEAENFLE